MEWTVHKMSREDAKRVCAWKYPGEYAVYDYPTWEELKKSGLGLGDDRTRRKEFWSVYAGDELVGHFRLAQKEDCVLIGLGLAPDRCGRGAGQAFLELILAQAASMFPGQVLRLMVRTFNQRAIRCYEKAGFSSIGVKKFLTPDGPADMVVMERNRQPQ